MKELPGKRNIEIDLDEQIKREHPFASRFEQIPILGPIVRVLHDSLADCGFEHPMRAYTDDEY